MAKLTSRGYSAIDQTNFVHRSAQAHTLQWKADVYRWQGGGGAVQTLYTGLPLTGGQLTLDSSNVTRRTLQLLVGGGTALVPRDSNDPLAPFGQFVHLYCRIDRADGSWFPWLMMGEYPIMSYSYERPSLIATVDCQDLSGRVNEFLHLNKRAYKGMRLDNAIQEMVNAAVPNKVYATHASDAAKAEHVTSYVAESGSGRWDSAADLAEKHGYETFFDSAGDLVIRHALGDADDDITQGIGPDIGTITSPVATITDGEGGTLVGMTATVTREGGCNMVRFNLNGTVTRRAKKQNKKKKGVETKEVDWNAEVHAEVDDGPAAWGDKFGFLPLIRDYNLHKVEDGEKASYQNRANHMLHRRRGVIRYIDFDIAGGYWLEPDDKIKIQYANFSEDHYVQSVIFDLTGQNATRMRTRSLAVLDPGPGFS